MNNLIGLALVAAVTGTGAAIGAAVADRRPALGAFIGAAAVQGAWFGLLYAASGSDNRSGVSGALNAPPMRRHPLHINSVREFP